MTHSPQSAGTELPGAGEDGAPPLPVANRIRPDPSDMIPAPDSQMPPPFVSSSSTHFAVIWWADAETPNTQPWNGCVSQCDPNAA